MRRLIVQCSCGERIQVPQSALGKAGICPSCGTTVLISRDNATPYRPGSPPPPRSGPPPDRSWNTAGGAGNAPDDIRRKFAEGVDLYFAKRYSEALVIFNQLAASMPHDADIQMGQSMCLNALRKISPLGIAQESRAQLPAPPITPEREEAILNGPTPDLDRDFFKRFLFDKMLHGGSDEIQMRAAELAAKMLGLLDAPADPQPVAQNEQNVSDNIRELYEEDAESDLRTTPFRRAAAPDTPDR